MASPQDNLRKKKLAQDQVDIDKQTAIMNSKQVNADSGLEGLKSSQVPASLQTAKNIGNRLVDDFKLGSTTLAEKGGLVKQIPKAIDDNVTAIKDLADNTGVTSVIKGTRNAIFGKPSLAGQSIQRSQASAGIAGSTTGDSSGTGVNTTQRSELGGVELSQTPKGLLSIKDQIGGTGTIRFNDGRTLGQDQLDYLASTIQKNADPEFQQRLADEAALSQSRYDAVKQKDAINSRQAELDFYKRAYIDALNRNDLVAVSQFSKKINAMNEEDIARAKIGADIASDQATIQSNSYNKGIDQRLQAAKQKDQLTKNFLDFVQESDKNGTGTPLAKFAAAKSYLGEISPTILNSILPPEVIQTLRDPDIDVSDKVKSIADLNFSEEDAAQILGQYGIQ